MDGSIRKLMNVCVLSFALVPMANQAEELARQVVVEHVFPVSGKSLWRLLSRFCSIEEWQDLVQDCVIDERQDGIYRTVVMKDATAFVERLESLSHDQMNFRYSIKSGPLDVENYQSYLQVVAIDDSHAKLSWTAQYEIKRSDQDITSGLEKLFRNGISGMETILNAKNPKITGE